jgi:hypothetical protein
VRARTRSKVQYDKTRIAVRSFLLFVQSGNKTRRKLIRDRNNRVPTPQGHAGEESGSDLGERVEGELGDGEELVLGDESLGAAVELAEALVEGHDLLLRD